jgi:hypothetical protein
MQYKAEELIDLRTCGKFKMKLNTHDYCQFIQLNLLDNSSL